MSSLEGDKLSIKYVQDDDNYRTTVDQKSSYNNFYKYRKGGT